MLDLMAPRFFLAFLAFLLCDLLFPSHPLDHHPRAPFLGLARIPRSDASGSDAQR